jgi:hypothetical protein
MIMPRSKNITRNRLGCFVIGLIVLAVVLLFSAIGLGLLGHMDTSKITDLPISDNGT